MDVPSAELFGRTFACDCGRTHRIQPKEVCYTRGIARSLPTLCARASEGRRVAVFMDERTRDVMGAQVCAVLSSDRWLVREVLVPDRPGGESPVCDDATKEELAAGLGECDLVVSVGAGVISDLGKWIAFERDTPFVAVATAASMNGYASANVAPTLKGVKSLVRARPPSIVAADPDVIENAPWKLTASGLGDIVAKPVSSADWRLNNLLFGDFYCERAVGLIADIEPLYLERPEALRRREPVAVEALFGGLLLTGVAMTMAETSAPSSGGEHMIGHTLDMMSSVDGVPHDLHGRQVGVGTVLASELYRRVLALESPAFGEPCVTVDRRFWGPLADIVERHYSDKIERLREARRVLRRGDAWDRMRERLAPMVRTPEAVHDCLRRAGAAGCAADIGCERERLLAAFLHAHEIRARFTILDLARLVGVMPGAGREIVERWG